MRDGCCSFRGFEEPESAIELQYFRRTCMYERITINIGIPPVCRMAEILRAPKGLDGVAVADTSIAISDADGTLIYRGYAIKDLFDHSTFEESTFLILSGKLPTRSELEDFEAKLRRYSLVPRNVYD